MNKQKGFTLIELLIVIAVIGILASVVLVGLGPIQKQGRDARRISDLKQIQNGLELYYGKNGAYPSSNSWSQLKTDLIGAEIGVSNIPDDPSSPARNYIYLPKNNGASYCLGAQLEDLNNPNWKRSVGCDPSYCFSGSGNPTQGQYYCVSL